MDATPEAIHPNARLYCDLMEFIKWRTGLVRETIELVKARAHYLDNRSAAEFCVLQLRFCCELLAIGCVAIHTDVPQTARLHSMWNADSIMKAFGKLKPRFFPHPVRSKRDAPGTWVHEAVSGALTKGDLLRMYNFFGRLLHTGSFEAYKNPSDQKYDFKMLEDFLGKLITLLNEHTYRLHDEKRMIRIIMNNVADGRVAMNELVAVQAQR